jgi:hypothetical protein
MAAARELGFVALLRDVSIRFSAPRKCSGEARPGTDGVHTVVYQREFVRCGKKRCKCAVAGGRGHGPYWYAYWRVAGDTRKKYIGKNFRELAALRGLDVVVGELISEGKKK